MSARATHVPRAPRPKYVAKAFIELQAIVLTPDNYGRLRFLLLSETSDGVGNSSKFQLLKLIPSTSDTSVPYKLWDRKNDKTLGEFWASPPKNKTKYWNDLYESLHGKEVTVTVTLRRFAFTNEEDKFISGTTLTLSGLDLYECNQKAASQASERLTKTPAELLRQGK